VLSVHEDGLQDTNNSEDLGVMKDIGVGRVVNSGEKGDEDAVV
jgi:hypothetical protein